MEPVVAIVVAAGSGSRLGGEVPKALRELAGRPLVSHSVERLAAGGVDAAVVVVADGLQDSFAAALAAAPIPVQLTLGGAERQDSVRAGLAAIAADPRLAGARHVLVHDAARALVPPAVVRRVLAALREGAVGCVPVVPVVDTIRQVDQSGSRVVDRAGLRAVQTPQGFELNLLAEAHQLAEARGLAATDDAVVVEALGAQITLVDGSRDALKVTEPLDLVLAEAILRRDR